MGHKGSPSSSLAVHYRPVQTPEEQLAMEAGLDTLIYMALRKIVEERKHKDAVERGFLMRSQDSTAPAVNQEMGVNREEIGSRLEGIDR